MAFQRKFSRNCLLQTILQDFTMNSAAPQAHEGGPDLAVC